MANRRRGDIPLELGGRILSLKLTLGGLAELEDLFGAGDLTGLGARFGEGRISARDLIGLVRIGLTGAGHALSDAEIEALSLEGGVGPLVTAVAAMFEAAFGASAAGAGPTASGEGLQPRP
jgi:hypothetical protein